MFDTSLYDGIVDVITSLHRRGFQLAIATSKPEPLAVEILEFLGVAHWFTTIGGDTLEGHRGSKALVVGEVLDRLGSPPPSSVLMVGDRHHDVEGAREHGVMCIGALWGYGSVAELEAAGAWAICTEPAELLAII